MKLLLLLSSIFISTITFAQTDSLAKKFPVDSNYLTSFDGTKIYYEVRGEGKPVLLLHGFMNTGKNVKNIQLYANLLNAGYKLIVPDLRGNGKSDKPHTAEAYLHDAEAKDMMLLMDHLNISKYAVVGYSRGSIIVSRLAVLDKRVQCAVMGGMGADFTNPEWPRRIMFYHALMYDTVPELKDMVAYVKKSGLDQLSLAYQQNGQPSTSKEEFAKVKQPIMVICGDIDSANGSGSALAKLIPHGSFATVPGDHNHAWHTIEFSNEVMAFLKRNNY